MIQSSGDANIAATQNREFLTLADSIKHFKFVGQQSIEGIKVTCESDRCQRMSKMAIERSSKKICQLKLTQPNVNVQFQSTSNVCDFMLGLFRLTSIITSICLTTFRQNYCPLKDKGISNIAFIIYITLVYVSSLHKKIFVIFIQSIKLSQATQYVFTTLKFNSLSQ